jgi:lysozyme
MLDDNFLESARIMLEAEEGKSYKPYRCTAGKLTIGIGRNLDDAGITDDTIYQMLWEDVKRCMEQSKRAFGEALWFELSDVRKLALINMIFNLGFGGFMKFKDFIALIKMKDFKTAAEALDHSLYAKQLPARVERIREMISNDKFPYKADE